MTEITEFSNEDYKKIVSLLNFLNINASSLKRNHLIRRIRIRMTHTKCNTVHEYYKYVLQNQIEKNELRLVFSINVTHFFRNADTFEYIKNNVIPKLARSVPEDKRLKFWSAGCADGAEPYSLAILLDQLNISSVKAHILATDYNSNLLKKARAGLYTIDYLKETSPDVQQKYFFHPSPSIVEIKSFIKNYVEFRTHNLTFLNNNLPKNTFDAILCRNVFIYFTKEQQLDIFNTFYNALKPNGFLIIGRTETIPISIKEKFTIVDVTHRIAIKV